MGNCISCSINVPWDQLTTLCCPEQPRKTITDLKNDWAKLKSAREDILTTLRERPELIPLEQENQWLAQVASLVDPIDKFLADHPQESANEYFCDYFPGINCIRSCCLWRKIAQLDQKVIDLVGTIPTQLVERSRIAPDQHVPTDPTTGMQPMLDEVWSHVENDDQQDNRVGLIGLHGMGGVGKTTLLKAVNNKLCSSSPKIFDLQLWIVVSKTPNLVNILNHVGKQIGLYGGDWERKSLDEKSVAICNVLRNKKYILLLDDLWEWFDLKTIGISLDHESQTKSKIIFTTRCKEVCGQMKAKKIGVKCLKEDDAWNLFKENVGEDALKAHHDIPRLAKDVMRECSGLPLALIVIGRALTCAETIQDWEHAIQVLKRYAAEFSTMLDEVFTPLKYSYDNLKNDAIRSCFLYCCLYAEDELISQSELVDKWICEGYLGRFGDLDIDRNEGYSYINTLVHASLLETVHGYDKVHASLLETVHGYVKMHDVIRDMALWIARDVFYVNARVGLTEVPKNNVEWEHVEKLSLMDNSIQRFNNGPNKVSNLETILLSNNRFSFIRNDLWKFVPNLKVLDLSKNSNLRGLPEEFCELVSLQYLNIASTDIQELPNEFRKLVNLKYLNLQYTSIIIRNGVLSGMKELSVFRCGDKVYSLDVSFVEVLVKESEGLSCLQDVAIPATSTVDIANLSSSIKLLSCTTELVLARIYSSTSLDISFLKHMKRLRYLCILKLRVNKIVVAEKQGSEISTINNQNGFSSLLKLKITSCKHLKNLSWVVFFPNLESINIARCDKMETLVSENEYRLDNQVEPFAKLQILLLDFLPRLASIYFTSLSLPRLVILRVGYVCKNLKRLPFNSNSCNQGRGISLIRGSNEWWNDLDWEDEATLTTFASCFVPW